MTFRLIVLACMGLFAGPLAAVPLWSVEDAGGEARIWLLGSIHLLRAEDQPLPEAVPDAYRRADRVVMELDPAELDPAAALAAVEKVGIMSPGNAALDVLTAEQWHAATALAEASGLALEAVAMLEPWFAAIVLYTGALSAAGYDPALGVDQQVAAWVLRDEKPAGGLETLEEQLRMFKELTAEIQVEMLIKTLEDLAVMEEETSALIGQWRANDVAALARRLETDFEGYEDLRDRIVTRRNHAWLAPVEALLEREGTSLVVVGALHLVGAEGLPALLEARGHRVIAHRAR